METTFRTNAPVIFTKNQGASLIPQRSASAAEPALPLLKTAATSADLGRKLEQADALREQALRQAANSFVISDQKFTIYKDLSGQFVTRFTSLRDGRVTYIPEPDVLSWLNQSGKGANPSLSLEV